ncbi:signal peptidase II [Candidatus Amarobacter glycogenicus]|uniref:signal peptidase II n=1 Tax=Candidatus Amarobacter glycogenicus TaxID=3140699 RepID=UPI0031CC5627
MGFSVRRKPGIGLQSDRLDSRETIRTPLIVAVSLTTLAVIAWYVLAAPRRPLMLAAFTAIATGAVGNNLLDRLMYGFVVDFVYWHIGDTFDWPVFNVADSLVVVGVGLLLLDTWLTRRCAGGVQPGESAPGVRGAMTHRGWLRAFTLLALLIVLILFIIFQGIETQLKAAGAAGGIIELNWLFQRSAPRPSFRPGRPAAVTWLAGRCGSISSSSWAMPAA